MVAEKNKLNKADFLKGLLGKTENFELEGFGIVVLKGLSVKDLETIRSLANEDEMLAALYTIVFGVVEPELTIEDINLIKDANISTAMKLSKRISELSGLVDEDKEDKNDSP